MFRSSAKRSSRNFAFSALSEVRAEMRRNSFPFVMMNLVTRPWQGSGKLKMQTRLTSLLVVATLSVMLLWLLLGCNIALAASGAQRDVSNGKNGKIVFLDGSRIYEINPDGTGQTSVTGPSVDVLATADMSPNGEKIAFVNESGDLYVMNADGSDRTRIINTPAAALSVAGPIFSPNGKKIAFEMDSSNSEIYLSVINTDGTGLTRLTKLKGVEVYHYVWSRDGTKMFFLNRSASAPLTTWKVILDPRQYYEINADGSGLTKVPNGTQIPKIVGGGYWSPECKEIAVRRYNDVYVKYPGGRETKINHSGDAYNPVLSPDCKKIAFTAAHRQHSEIEIDVVNVDGTGLTRLTKEYEGILLGWRSTATAPRSATTLAESGGLSPMTVVAAGALALLIAGGVIAAAVVRRY
jgi:WD40-like Beta Propeller Repeat